ncbi:hypothetical protein HQ560_04715 [bacterium]|nr:hypothetical protein [bacterium]
MSGKMHFVVGLVMLALGLGLAIGSGVFAGAAHGQGSGAVARSANYALVPGIGGVRQKSQLLYVLDDRTEAIYVIEVAARDKAKDVVTVLGWQDLNGLSRGVQRTRNEKEK